jgi:hypothetical protein
MEFFDDKEEVLDIQLTQFGKHLLSLGKWRPVYYAFFDDNILYDGKYADLTEEQNDIEGRIQDTTPQMHTQHVFSGRETDFLRILEAKDDKDLDEREKVRVQSTPEKDYSLVSPLGNSEMGVENVPRWSVKSLSGEMKNSEEFLTGSFQNLKIPQINMQISYRALPRSTRDFPEGIESFGQIEAEELNLGVFSDGTFLDIISESLLLDISELNTEFDVENFEIEVFKVERSKLPGTNNPNIDTLNQLFFEKRKEQIQNNILISDRPDNEIIPTDPTYVEYYFDVFLDDEIGENTICAAINNLKSQGIYVDTEFDCPEAPLAAAAVNPYLDQTETTLVVCNDSDSDKPPRASVVKSGVFSTVPVKNSDVNEGEND